MSEFDRIPIGQIGNRRDFLEVTVSLIYPHQLFSDHPMIGLGEKTYLIEDPLFFGTDSEQPLKLHVKKLIFLRAAMQTFAKRKNSVEYVELPEGGCRSDELLQRIISQKVTRIVCIDPVDYLLERRIRRFCREREIEMELRPSPMFVTPDEWMHEVMDGMKKPFMKTFYEAQRKRMDVLMDGDQPEGGKYSFDAENRK
ncbi:MAG: cryptochrome/photolyase family protein, partial [Akkermansiaceae bacterium]